MIRFFALSRECAIVARKVLKVEITKSKATAKKEENFASIVWCLWIGMDVIIVLWPSFRNSGKEKFTLQS